MWWRCSVRSSAATSCRRGAWWSVAAARYFTGFLGKLFLLGAAFVGVLASEAALRRGEFAELNIFYVPLAAVGVFLAVVVAQYVMLAGVGLVTRSFADVATLVRIRLVYFALAP